MRTIWIVFLLLPTLVQAADPGWFDVWDKLLGRHVSERGVSYARWKADSDDRKALEAIVREIGDADLSALEPETRFAFLLNAYNAWMIELVLQNYPVRSVSAIGPKEFSVFYDPLIRVGGRAMSLDTLEKEVMFGEFRDLRMHWGINCASGGCPPLGSTAFRTSNLQAELDARSAAFAASPRGHRLDLEPGAVHVNRIFEWFAKDFEADGGALGHLNRFLPEGRKLPANLRLAFQDYDWALNEVHP